jgi:hypothetical protein
MKNTIKKIITTLSIILGLISLNNCNSDDLEPTLAQSKSVEGSITSVDNLFGILKGIHDKLSEDGYYGRDIIAANEVRSDNCFSNGNSGRFSTQAEYEYSNTTGFFWDEAYEVIANANIIINTDLTSLTGDLDYGKHIQGQALTLRALAHFDLLKNYGQQHATSGDLGVPLVTTFKGEDLSPARNTIDQVKQGIYDDLMTAYELMDSKFDTTKIYASKYSAKALESRVGIYFEDWTIAKNASEAVINSGKYSIISETSFVSSWDSEEAANSIFELSFSSTDNLSSNSLPYIYRFPDDNPSGYGDVEVESSVINIFDATDVRKDILGYQDSGARLRNIGKYPDTATGTSNIPLMRYEEVILNYAEALYEINNADPNALVQLNMIPINRGANSYITINKNNIILERRKELMFEGFRFDDLMRTGSSVDVLGSLQNLITTLSYPNNLFAFPIPVSETNANSNIVQNSGY